MSHRNALFVSFALAVAMALGIFAARDRLFQAGAAPNDEIAPTATSVGVTSGETQPVIEVTLPQPTAVSIARERDDDEDESRVSRTSRERDDEWEDDEHEEFDDD